MVKLGEVTEIIMGQSPASSTYNSIENGLPFYQGKADFGENVIKEPRTWCTDPKKQARKNDVLISVRAPVGPVNLADRTLCIGRGLAAVRANSSLAHFMYIYYLLKSIEEKWGSRSTGSTFQSINKESISHMTIPFPPLPTQRKIVEILDAADLLRRKRREADAKMKGLIPAIFVKMFGDPATNPMGWEVKRLGAVCCRGKQKIIPKDHPEKVFRYVGLEHIESGTGELAKDNSQRGVEIKSAKGVFRKNQILYGRLRPNLNKVWLTDDSGICSTDIWVLSITENISLQYLFRYLLLDQTAKKLSSLVEGINLPRVNVHKFDDLEIPVPPLPLQLEFVKQLDHIQMHMQKSKNEDLLLHSLFASLTHKAFRGELV